MLPGNSKMVLKWIEFQIVHMHGREILISDIENTMRAALMEKDTKVAREFYEYYKFGLKLYKKGLETK